MHTFRRRRSAGTRTIRPGTFVKFMVIFTVKMLPTIDRCDFSQFTNNVYLTVIILLHYTAMCYQVSIKLIHRRRHTWHTAHNIIIVKTARVQIHHTLYYQRFPNVSRHDTFWRPITYQWHFIFIDNQYYLKKLSSTAFRQHHTGTLIIQVDSDQW